MFDIKIPSSAGTNRMPPQTMQFGGEERFNAPPQKLFDQLTNLDTLATTIPDLVSAERTDPNTLKCVVRPGFSFLRGTMKLQISVSDLQPPEKATMHVDAQGIGIAMRLESHLHISPDGIGSLLKWDAQVLEMKGLISTVSPGLVKAAADQVVRLAWEGVRGRMKNDEGRNPNDESSTKPD
jgi:carbon monoxide dehydrogenase subunit G